MRDQNIKSAYEVKKRIEEIEELRKDGLITSVDERVILIRYNNELLEFSKVE